MKGHELPGPKQRKKSKLKDLSDVKPRGSVDEVNISKMTGLGPRKDFGGTKNQTKWWLGNKKEEDTSTIN